MSGAQRREAYALEGQTVSVALADGSRIDDAVLVSVGRARAQTLWLYSNGADLFLRDADVVDLWPPAPLHARAA